MRIETSVSVLNVTPTVNIEHLGETISFSVSFYRRNSFMGEFDVFGQINAFWADQPLPVQGKIFQIYKDIFNNFYEMVAYTKTAMREFLQEKIKELMVYHDFELIQEWIAFRAVDIQLPASIKEEFVPNVDRNLSIGKTYTAPDYRKLVAMAMSLRCIIPIWGEYIFSIKAETESNFKELHAFQLVDQVLTPQISAVAKLMEYIELTIASAKISPHTGIFKGISSSDYPRWMLALITIRCLAVGDIRGTNPDAHLVTYIHMFIQSRLQAKENAGDNKIEDKKIDDSESENGSRASTLERYKIKANASVGDIVEQEFFLWDSVRVTRKLAPGMPYSDVLECMENMKEYEGTPTVPQVTMLRWVFSSVVSCNIPLYMPEQLVKQMLAIMEASLRYRGHPYLAILSTCFPVKADSVMVVSAVDSKMRINPLLAEQLEIMFPYTRNQKTKTKIIGNVNLAMECIDKLANEFMGFGWRPTAKMKHIDAILNQKAMRFPIKPDIKSDLARLVIELQNM